MDAQPIGDLSLPVGVSKRLSHMMGNVEGGSNAEYTSPIFGVLPDEEIFSAIESILDVYELTPTLREIENSNRDKFGPRSVAKPWVSRKEDLHEYFEHSQLADEEFARIWTKLDSGGGLGNGRLRPSTVASAVSDLIASSNSGLPYLSRKGEVRERIESDAVADRGVYPCVLFTRTQERGKTRNIWGYPSADTVWEQQFFRPWLAVEKMQSCRAALHGPDAVDAGVTALLSSKRSDETLYCVDFEAFDSSVRPELATAAFKEISDWYQRNFRGEVAELAFRFLTIPIVTPEGIWSGTHGVPSGSSWTNTIDSLVQLEASGHPRELCQVQGDDGCYLISAQGTKDLEDSFARNGLKLNEEKSHVSPEEAVYLQRYYHPNYPSVDYDRRLGGVYSLYRAAHRIKYLERWTDFEAVGISGDDYFSLRTVMILENCKHHPGHREMVQFVQRSDQNGLRFNRSSIPAFSKAEEGRSRARASWDIGKIDTWRTLRILREAW